MKTTLMACLCAIGLVFAGRASAEIDPDTLVGAWLFDEGAGDTAADASTNGNDGALLYPLVVFVMAWCGRFFWISDTGGLASCGSTMRR